MKKLLLLLIIGSWIAPAFAKDQPVIDVFGCKVKAGKTIANFDTAANAWAAQADKLPENKSYFAAILKPFRGETFGYDVVWIGSSPNLGDWAKGNTAGLASAGETAALAAIDATVSCESAMYLEAPVFEGMKDEPGDNDALIETYNCNLNPGKTAKDADAFDAGYAAASKALKGTFSTFRWAPFFGNSGYSSVYLTVNDDFTSFAAAVDAFNNSKEGQASNAAAAATFKCDSALWLGHVLHQPAAPPKP